MDQESVIRMTSAAYRQLRDGFAAGKEGDEQFAFALCAKAKGRRVDVYLVRELLFPDPGDLALQGPAGVGPSRPFQNLAYALAQDQALAILDFHTHPFQNIPRFSGIDDYQSKRNAEFVRKHLPPETTMLMAVFNQDLSCFEGRVLDKETGRFREISRIEVLGKAIRFIGRAPEQRSKVDERFSRHLLIPGWNQTRLERLKVVLVGLGGNGAALFSGLLSLGVGRDGGWIVACDPDVIEPSNLPRIPYARPADVGKSKARVARRYARERETRADVYCFHGGVEDPRLRPFIKEAHLLVGAVDRDRVRSRFNEWSSRYLIPLLDVAAEVIPGQDGCRAGGQVRVVEPGETACLICSGGLNLSAVDPEELSEADRKVHRAAGYIRGLDESPTPSVLDLNGVASHLGISHLRRIVFGEPLDGREYLFYDRQNCTLIAAALPRPNPDCPVCGLLGVLGRGDGAKAESIPAAGAIKAIRLEDGEIAKTDTDCVRLNPPPENAAMGSASNATSVERANSSAGDAIEHS